MLDWFSTPVRVPNEQLPSTARWLPTLAEPYQRRNGSWQMVPGAETQFTVASAGVANGGNVLIWTAGAGNTLYLTHLSFSTSVAGAMALGYNGVSFWSALCLAGTVVILPIGGFGLFMSAVAAGLRLTNNTGGASDLRASAWGAEVTF